MAMASGREHLRKHARQLLLPEIGEAGQAQLCAHRVELPPSAASEIAVLYLGRAGVHASLAESAPMPDALSAERVRLLAGGSELEPAAAFLAGAFAAVEEIKRVVGAGKPGRLPERLSATRPEDRS
jgi:hypothetical protein